MIYCDNGAGDLSGLAFEVNHRFVSSKQEVFVPFFCHMFICVGAVVAE